MKILNLIKNICVFFSMLICGFFFAMLCDYGISLIEKEMSKPNVSFENSGHWELIEWVGWRYVYNE